jgi:hypothetical protein
MTNPLNKIQYLFPLFRYLIRLFSLAVPQCCKSTIFFQYAIQFVRLFCYLLYNLFHTHSNSLTLRRGKNHAHHIFFPLQAAKNYYFEEAFGMQKKGDARKFDREIVENGT